MTLPDHSSLFASEYAYHREIMVDQITEWAYELGLPTENAARLAAALVQLSEEGL